MKPVTLPAHAFDNLTPAKVLKTAFDYLVSHDLDEQSLSDMYGNMVSERIRSGWSPEEAAEKSGVPVEVFLEADRHYSKLGKFPRAHVMYSNTKEQGVWLKWFDEVSNGVFTKEALSRGVCPECVKEGVVYPNAFPVFRAVNFPANWCYHLSPRKVECPHGN